MRERGHGPWDAAPSIDRRVWEEATPAPFWLDSQLRPEPRPPLEGELECDLAVGHTGLGVGVSRFGARVALDLLDGRETEATRLRSVRSKPIPFPPARYCAHCRICQAGPDGSDTRC